MPSGKKAPWHWKSWKRINKGLKNFMLFVFCESMKKFHIVLYLLAQSDIIPIRKQGGENYGKNGEYQCPY